MYDEDHHRDRQPEVELHESHAVDIGLAGGRNERDRARLRRHDRQADRVPGHMPAGDHERAHIVRASSPPEAVQRHVSERGAEDQPVSDPHAVVPFASGSWVQDVVTGKDT